MRQLLRKHSSEDGEIEDYLQTGAFEKRSNEMRLFSLDGTAHQDIKNMIELSQSNGTDVHAVGEKILSPVEDFGEEIPDFRPDQILNQVQHLQQPLSKVKGGKEVFSPEILNQVRQNIVFSGNIKESDEREEGVVDDYASHLSSSEMNCTQTESKTTTNNQSMKTKDQREIQAIIATTKQFTCGTQNSSNNASVIQATDNDYAQKLPNKFSL